MSTLMNGVNAGLSWYDIEFSARVTIGTVPRTYAGRMGIFTVKVVSPGSLSTSKVTPYGLRSW